MSASGRSGTVDDHRDNCAHSLEVLFLIHEHIYDLWTKNDVFFRPRFAYEGDYDIMDGDNHNDFVSILRTELAFLSRGSIPSSVTR